MKYKVNDRVKIKNVKSLLNNEIGTVTAVNPKARFPKSYPYRVYVRGMEWWYPESELESIGE